MTARNEVLEIAMSVICGELPGDKAAALIAHSHIVFVATRDLILGETTSDEQLNAEIVKLVKGESK